MNLTTAKLERCFTEHIDTCTYRLDAWQNALFRIRMQQQRQITDGGEREQRKKGIYLGAYGWVENIRPSAKETIAGDTVPEKLRPPNQSPLYSYGDNGGFVHAPSLNHASAAAVLRSGYLMTQMLQTLKQWLSIFHRKGYDVLYLFWKAFKRAAIRSTAWLPI